MHAHTDTYTFIHTHTYSAHMHALTHTHFLNTHSHVVTLTLSHTHTHIYAQLIHLHSHTYTLSLSHKHTQACKCVYTHWMASPKEPSRTASGPHLAVCLLPCRDGFQKGKPPKFPLQVAIVLTLQAYHFSQKHSCQAPGKMPYWINPHLAVCSHPACPLGASHSIILRGMPGAVCGTASCYSLTERERQMFYIIFNFHKIVLILAL